MHQGWRNARDAVVHADGSIAVNFSFNADAFDGPVKTYHPSGFVLDPTNALWGMRFVWPIMADYRISYVASDYSLTVIGREAREQHLAAEGRLPEAVVAAVGGGSNAMFDLIKHFLTLLMIAVVLFFAAFTLLNRTIFLALDLGGGICTASPATQPVAAAPQVRPFAPLSTSETWRIRMLRSSWLIRRSSFRSRRR